MRPGRILNALLLIAAGVVLLLMNLGYFSLRLVNQWPLIPLLLGLSLWTGILDDRHNWGLAIPGTILTCSGAVLYLCANFGWRLMVIWWPMFIVGPGVGFFLAFLIGGQGRNWGLLIPGGILTVVGLSFLLENTVGGASLVLPLVLIGAGLLVFLTAWRRNSATKDGTAKGGEQS